jgi:hypothetical protein
VTIPEPPSLKVLTNIQRPLFFNASRFLRRAREQDEDEDKEMKRVSKDEDNQEGIYLNENGMLK